MTDHPTIEGVTVRENRYIPGATILETDNEELFVSFDPSDSTVYVHDVAWRSPQEILTLIAMLNVALETIGAEVTK